MLGVFIGVAALIAMVAVGEGANAAVQKQIESLGTNLLVRAAGRGTTRRRARRVRQRLDADRRRRPGDPARGTGRRQVGYLIRQIGQVEYGNQNWSTNIQGVSAELSARHQLDASPTGREA